MDLCLEKLPICNSIRVKESEKFMKKTKGIITYLLLTCILGALTIITIPYSMAKESYLYYGLVFVFLICTILSGMILKRYQKTIKYFDLGQYLTSQQEDFARIIHDEIIQDLYGIINNLNLRTPDVEKAKTIAENLENKSRSIMTSYRQSIISDMSLEENIKSIFYDVETLYPDKNFEFSIEISENIQVKNSERLRTILIITKELINNIYKHSKGSKITYKLDFEEGDIILKVTNDGATALDYKNILESRGGVLFMKFLLDSLGGDIKYFYEGGILKTQVRLGEN